MTTLQPVQFNTALQTRPPEVETIIEVSRVARDVYAEERELHFHEQVFVTEWHAATRHYAETCGAARRNPDLTAECIDITCRLALRTEARQMGDALRAYRKAREEFYNFEVEEVEFQMAAE
jgi:hypothetical protein